MSEYIEVFAENTDDPAIMLVRTNLLLADEETEVYLTIQDMEEGSALAQAIAPVEGIVRLRIEEDYLTVWRDLKVPWHLIISEITVALKEFFL
ncbi:MAG TPA: NifU N-terminal domain-containing protein [Patescibacteria group bacterium]|jgi:hypothetical protein|nr:NifU N-terminal domain-containing protein [Patescibacteria group bacterium]